MVKAIQIDKDGNPIKGSERKFTNVRWAKMNEQFASKLRWRLFDNKKKAVKKDRVVFDDDTVLNEKAKELGLEVKKED